MNNYIVSIVTGECLELFHRSDQEAVRVFFPESPYEIIYPQPPLSQKKKNSESWYSVNLN